VAAERAGFDGFAFTEHPAPSTSWLAAGVIRLSIRSWRSDTATVDWLSGGRFILGAGTGYLTAEYFAFGVEFAERNMLFD